MKQSNHFVVLAFAVLLFGSGHSSAIDNKANITQQPTIKADANQNAVKSGVAAKHKHTAPIKLVDINSASKAELMKLPGIGATEADKIIAGRPFGTKEWLVTNNIVPGITYQALKHKIECKITKKDFDKIKAQAVNKSKK